MGVKNSAGIDSNYERLEWIGDAYLELIASALIYKTFPCLPAGQCAQHREILVRNETLRTYTVAYGLDKRMDMPPELRDDYQGPLARPKLTIRIKVYGDIFESYVGAVIMADPAHGVERVTTWLKALWATRMAEQIRNQEKRAARASARAAEPRLAIESQPAKVQLSQAIGMPGVILEYKDMEGKQRQHKDHKIQVFTVGCYLTGHGETKLLLGHGTAAGKKEAGAKAAQMALQNKKLLVRLAGKKVAFLAARKANEGEVGDREPGDDDAVQGC